MSVFNATLGDEIVVIDDFVACRSNEQFCQEASVSFTVGQRVKFIGVRPCPNMPLNITMVIFAYHGQEYLAINDLFVSPDHWERIYEQVVSIYMRDVHVKIAKALNHNEDT